MAVGTITQLNMDPVLSNAEPGIAWIGGLKLLHFTVQPTSGANYAVGGVPITAAQLNLNRVLGGWAAATTQAATVGPGEVVVLPQADGSILLKCGLAAGTGDNAANADLHLTSVDLYVFGI